MIQSIEVATKEKLSRLVEEKRQAGELKLPPERDLSELFGVSRSTISKVLYQLAGEGVVTRKKGSGTFITENERLNSQLCIGVGFENIYHPDWGFYGKNVEGIYKAAYENDIDIQIFDRLGEQFDRSFERNRIVKIIEAGLLDGMILASKMSIQTAAKISSMIPAVTLGGDVDCIDLPSVKPDYFAAGFLAADYLLKNGHRNIGYVYLDDNCSQVSDIYSGVRLAMQNSGVAAEKNLCLDVKGKNHISQLPRALEYFIRNNNITAIVAEHDRIAAKIIKSLESAGIKLPGDISIVGFGNLDVGNTTPLDFLTTVNMNLEQLSKTALEMLLDKIRNGSKRDCGSLERIVHPELIIRNSVRELS
jgi:GntR family transcriptional regulator of arabinose operon